MNSLPSVKKGLLAHELDAQVMIYDSTDDRIHLLDSTTACVLELLQKGDSSPETISAEVARRLGVQQNEDLVLLAIEELDQASLLQREDEDQGSVTRSNRRDLVRKLAAAGLAGVMIPAIATLAASRAYAASLAAGGDSCKKDGDCASMNCYTAGAASTCGFFDTCAPATPACGATTATCTITTANMDNQSCECCSGTCMHVGATSLSGTCT